MQCSEQQEPWEAKKSFWDTAMKIIRELDCLKDKKPVARQGFVPTVLKCQLMLHGSGTFYLFWVRQPENIPLVQTGDPKPDNSASPMPCVYVSVNVLQHKAGPTYLATSKRRHRYGACGAEEELWAVPLRGAAASTAPPR